MPDLDSQKAASGWLRRATAKLTLGGRNLASGLDRFRRPEHYVVSFPKSGRTWLRAMVGTYLIAWKQLSESNFLRVNRISALIHDIPIVHFTHEGVFSSANASLGHSRFKNRKVVLLVRDIRDTLVSYYMQCSKREKTYDGDLSSFIRDERFGAPRLVSYLNEWVSGGYLLKALLLVKYESLHRSTVDEFNRLLLFLDIPVDPRFVASVVDNCSFENLRKLEEHNAIADARLSPGDPTDLESYKLRRGRVGGYVSYLSSSDIEYLNEMIRRISPFYGFSQSPPSPPRCGEF